MAPTFVQPQITMIIPIGSAKTNSFVDQIFITMFGNYLHDIESLVDELAITNSPFDGVDLVIHTLNGLGPEYKEVVASTRTRKNPINFEEMHGLFTDLENYLTMDESPFTLPQHIKANHIATKEVITQVPTPILPPTDPHLMAHQRQ
ncbi:hypothetical protein CR513_37212, partial [Mucuna pruriens]